MIDILLVDDDRDILDIMRLDLEDNPHYAVDTCSASTDALKMIKRKDYHVIIADWRMPVMNGTELIRQLRRSGCSSLVILYSGHNVSSDIRMALDSGAEYYVHRGGDPDTEFAQLRQLIDKAAAGKGSSGTAQK